MNVRKPTDYSAMYGMLDQLMGSEFPQMELYFEIGKIVCAHPERGHGRRVSPGKLPWG